MPRRFEARNNPFRIYNLLTVKYFRGPQYGEPRTCIILGITRDKLFAFELVRNTELPCCLAQMFADCEGNMRLYRKRDLYVMKVHRRLPQLDQTWWQQQTDLELEYRAQHRAQDTGSPVVSPKKQKAKKVTKVELDEQLEAMERERLTYLNRFG